MGGILHTLKIPFTGLFIGGSAVIFISLIAYYADSRKILFESTVKVILVKFVVSPYSPINAYLAVLLQFSLGYILFFYGFNRISPIILGLLSLLFSAFQKIIILTLIFGMTLWESIDVFFEFILKSLKLDELLFGSVSLSYIIIGLYILSHIIGGLLAGVYAAKLPKRLINKMQSRLDKLENSFDSLIITNEKKKTKKKWWLKPSSVGLFIFSLILIVLSFVFEDFDKNIPIKILIMLGRSILIITVWYYFISPLLLKVVRYFLNKRNLSHSNEIEGIVNIFPNIKSVIKYSWEQIKNEKGIKKFLLLFDKVLVNYLLVDSSDE